MESECLKLYDIVKLFYNVAKSFSTTTKDVWEFQLMWILGNLTFNGCIEITFCEFSLPLLSE